MSVKIKAFYNEGTSTLSYIVFDSKSLKGMIIDPVLDFDIYSGCLCYYSANLILDYIDSHHLDIDWIVETHTHADHITAAQFFKSKLGAKVAISETVKQVQQTFNAKMDLNIHVDGSQFDHLFVDNEVFSLGDIPVRVIATPGHTPDSVCYLIDGNAFVGDTLFMPDSGTARCDFPNGDASQLFHSIQRLFEMGDDLILWMCHDYQPHNRELVYKTTVLEQKKYNIHLKHNTNQHDYVLMRQLKDAALETPKLLLPAIQINCNAGVLPLDKNNHLGFIKIPLKLKAI
ncbi:MBL fold metallo-hydrolase [Pseudoalteromonas denitrificans]|uniref:Glyoxylase, beta-lactamase superfamily II n=1 Tax=Pseudoalteromonas denitrificans DSM 6059 TaxID=1123010 RepID=A0A1I1MIR7_9GAMM|nr:MBL fold metallo-hydrolase [Pseudoalteromonas denitrificans]SFC84742.1 Glyoxylase, beta-lactamase superfamily II [Pseudoalteromonas denitrificans DSM 6059]